MKQPHPFREFCAIVLAAVLSSACASVPQSNVAQATNIEPTATLEGPTSLPDGKLVRLRFTVVNDGDVDLYLLKWYTPLEGILGEIFRVEHDGQVIPYEGPLVMRGNPGPEDYVLLKPGAPVSAEVDLATVYDFSRAGEYTIQFLSPSISHLAKTKDEMASTVDELGPVQIPCNQLHIEIESASDSFTRRTDLEAAQMIQDYLARQKPQLNPDLYLALEEVPVLEAWELLRVQVFRMTVGYLAIEPHDGQVELVLDLAEDLPDRVRDRVSDGNGK